VNKLNTAVIFFIVFVFTAVFLRFTGFIDLPGLELLSYLLTLSGAAIVYTSFGNDRKGILFTGSTLFLLGILVFINQNFELEDTRVLIFPSVLFISGIGFFLLYLDETVYKIFLVLSILFFTAGILVMLFTRLTAFNTFFSAFRSMIESYWFIIIIVFILLLLLGRDTKAE
jgi:hypothetical protein